MITIYAVVFGNYYPREVDSIWLTEELANKRAEQLEGDWRVVTMTVYEDIHEVKEER